MRMELRKTVANNENKDLIMILNRPYTKDIKSLESNYNVTIKVY